MVCLMAWNNFDSVVFTVLIFCKKFHAHFIQLLGNQLQVKDSNRMIVLKRFGQLHDSVSISFLKYLFIFGSTGALLLGMGFLQLQYTNFSLWWLLSWIRGSRVDRLSICGSQAQLPRGMWNLLRPGMEPMFPALTRGFLTIGPPGKSQ